MIYKFVLFSGEKNNFSRTIEIDADSNFLQLRNVILDSVGYAKDNLNSFFICDDSWGMHQEVTLEDMGSASDEDIYLMADTSLYDLIEDEGQKLMFVFDYFTERAFSMELVEIIPNRFLTEPICTMKKGTPPPQVIDMDKFENELETKNKNVGRPEDLDEDFLNDNQFNEDEINDGFEID